MKKKYSEEFYLKRFQEVVVFLTAVGIKKHFRNIAAYKRAANSSRAFHLAIKWDVLQKLTTLRIDGKLSKRFEDFVGRSADLFTYHRHCHKTYRSGKHFARNAFFELSDKVLEDYFSAPDDNFNTRTCHFLSKEAHKFIDKHVYKYIANNKNNRETDMTKKEKDKIRQECAEGKHAFTAEFLIKQREKEERQAKKRQQLRNYVVDEQDKQLIAACEACMANPYAYLDDDTDDDLTDEEWALLDDVVDEYKKLHRKAS